MGRRAFAAEVIHAVFTLEAGLAVVDVDLCAKLWDGFGQTFQTHFALESATGFAPLALAEVAFLTSGTTGEEVLLCTLGISTFFAFIALVALLACAIAAIWNFTQGLVTFQTGFTLGSWVQSFTIIQNALD